MTVCKCGNVLDRTGVVKVTMHPCQCAVKGKERRGAPDLDLLNRVPERVYLERKRVGLPLETPAERSSTMPWW